MVHVLKKNTEKRKHQNPPKIDQTGKGCDHGLGQSRAVDPQSFYADPDPAVFLNADPDPDPGPGPA